MQRPYVRVRTLAAGVLFALAFTAPALASSKVAIATLGGAAPGGGVFAGPGFTGWPTAAGQAWVAFRSLITGGSTSEAIVVSHLVNPITRTQVARIGQSAPGGGTFKRFVGQPAVNKNGQVAFLAQVTRAADVQDDPSAPTPAGIFFFDGQGLTAVALSGDANSAGTLDLDGTIDSADTPENAATEHGPVLNDAGAVAFSAAVRGNAQSTGAIFLATPGGPPVAQVRIGDSYDGGTFTYLAPPVLNNNGLLAFHAIVNDPNGLDGIFEFPDIDGEVNLLVEASQLSLDETPPDSSSTSSCTSTTSTTTTTLPGRPVCTKASGGDTVIEDFIALNDAGEIAFLAGPSGESSRTVLLFTAGMAMKLVSPDFKLAPSEIVSGVSLGPTGGSRMSAPSITPDGKVAVFLSLNGGAAEAMAVAGASISPKLIVTTLGLNASPSPVGGTYAGAESGPAIDASGGIAFLTRIAGGSSAEAVVYISPGQNGFPDPTVGSLAVLSGDASPTSGFFAGPPFSPPAINDQGDVVFRAFVAHGPAAAGIFRSSGGTLAPVALAGDHVPGHADQHDFTDFYGNPVMNAHGAVSFSADVADEGGEVFIADGTGIRTITSPTAAITGREAEASFRNVAANTAIDDSGRVAFRAHLNIPATETAKKSQVEALMLADPTGNLQVLVEAGDPAPTDQPMTFSRLHDPTLIDGPAIVFNAKLLDANCQPAGSGIFQADVNGVTAVLVQKGDIGNGITAGDFTGNPAGIADGQLAFLVDRNRVLSGGGGATKPLGISLLRRTPQGLGLVVGQNMPGPIGGTFRKISQPTMNSTGDIAFRASFLPFTGGVAGYFLQTADGLRQIVAQGENAPGGGRFSSLGARAALNDNDDLVFGASLSGGAHNGLFAASPTTLDVPQIVIRLGQHGHADRITVKGVLHLGHLNDGVDPVHETVVVNVSGGTGTLWSSSLAPGRLKATKKGFVAVRKGGGDFSPDLHALRLTIGHDGTPSLSATSVALHIPRNGGTPLVPPLSVTIQVGDDSGVTILPCRPSRRGLRCNAS